MDIYLPNYDLSCSLSKTNLHIKDSYKIKDPKEKEEVILHLLELEPDYERRNVPSLIREWKAHNILYKWGMFKDSTRDVDLDVYESRIHRLGYWILATFFRE